MQCLDCSHWTNLEKLSGLLFFAQLIDEMLYDYTLDSYKPLALNSRLLCIETLETIEEIRGGFIPAKNLIPVLEELKWSLNSDFAAKELLGVKHDLYINHINPNCQKLKEVENTVKFLYNALKGRRYLQQIKESLLEAVKSSKQKERIRYLTGILLSELMNYGYHPDHIDYQSYNFFFNPKKRAKIEDAEIIQQFFEIFNFEKNEFKVVFIGGIVFRNFKDILNKINIVVTKKYNCFSKLDEDIAFRDSKKDNESFVIFSKIEGLDHHSVREYAETILGNVSGLFNFFHHKEKPHLNDKCVVQRSSDNYIVIIDKPTKSILKVKYDENSNIAAKSVDKTLTLDLDTESMYRIMRSIELHGAAISSNSLENQLLDLWAALETLLPKDTESNKDRIVQICDRLLPFLQLNYINKQLEEMRRDLFHWNKVESKKVLLKIDGAEDYSDLEKIGAFIALNENLELRENIYKQLASFPLLKNRIFTLHKSFSTPDTIEKALIEHERKILWHLRRIYRVRGLIIHSGKYPSYTAILIENLHNYLDILIRRIMELASEGVIKSIEQGIFETSASLELQLSLLRRHKGEALDQNNFQEALIGELLKSST